MGKALLPGGQLFRLDVCCVISMGIAIVLLLSWIDLSFLF